MTIPGKRRCAVKRWTLAHFGDGPPFRRPSAQGVTGAGPLSCPFGPFEGPSVGTPPALPGIITPATTARADQARMGGGCSPCTEDPHPLRLRQARSPPITTSPNSSQGKLRPAAARYSDTLLASLRPRNSRSFAVHQIRRAQSVVRTFWRSSATDSHAAPRRRTPEQSTSGRRTRWTRTTPPCWPRPKKGCDPGGIRTLDLHLEREPGAVATQDTGQRPRKGGHATPPCTLGAPTIFALTACSAYLR